MFRVGEQNRRNIHQLTRLAAAGARDNKRTKSPSSLLLLNTNARRAEKAQSIGDGVRYSCLRTGCITHQPPERIAVSQMRIVPQRTRSSYKRQLLRDIVNSARLHTNLWFCQVLSWHR